MKRNIQLLKLLLPLDQMYFWNGIWLLFYLSITNYSGVGIIEAIVYAASFSLEIPTGAIADMFGKKKTLFVAYFSYAIGNIIMANSTSLIHLISSTIFLALSGALFSGTAQAMLYDSLKEDRNEKQFDTLYSQIQTYGLIGMAIASFAGGFLYSMNHQYPWYATAATGFIGMFIILFLKEPKIDTEKFSLKAYIKQNINGFRELFKSSNVIPFVLQLLVIYSFINIVVNVLDGGITVQIGLTEEQMGILFGVLPLLSALGTYIYSKFHEKISSKLLFTFFVAVTTILSVAISPFVGVTIIIVLLAYRSILYPVIDIISQNFINAYVESKYRATTLSTFSMLMKLPYVLVAYWIGGFIDRYSALSVSMWLSFGFLVLYIFVTTLIRTESKLVAKV